MGGKSSAPSPPDYTPIATANMDAAKLQDARAGEQLDWAKEQYRDTAPFAHEYLRSMIDNTEAQTDAAQKDRSRYEAVYQPVEDKFVGQAMGWNSPARADQQAGAAKADVTAAFEASRTAALANLESYGIDPSQTRFGALDLGTRISQAAATAAAGTQSRLNTEATALGLEGEAINIGKGYPGQVSQSYAGATSAGQAGVTSAINTSGAYGNLMGTPTQWSGLATGSRAGATQALNAGFNNALGAAQLENQQQSNLMSGIGSLVGGAITAGTLFKTFK